MGKCVCSTKEEVRKCMANCDINQRNIKPKKSKSNPMTPITTTKAKLLFVEVPDDAKDICTNVYNNLVYWDKGKVHAIDIPPSSTFLFATKQGGEEDWKGVVDDPNILLEYPDYTRSGLCLLCTATESGLSLQKANGMDVNKNYAVIEILKK